MPNWYKAIWLEYGTKHQSAQPFVRPTIKGAEGVIKATIERVFNEKVK